MTATTTATVLNANQLAYIASAAAKIRKAVTALRTAGLTDESQHVRDLERIHGILTATVKPASKPADTVSPPPAPRTDTIKAAPTVKPAVPAPAPQFHTAGPVVVKGRVVSTPATPAAVEMVAKVAAQTAAPMAAPAPAPTVKPAPKGIPTPMADALAGYRQLQTKAKALKIKASGTATELAARIAEREANPPAPKVAKAKKAAKAAAPTVKADVVSILYVRTGDSFRPATPEEITAVMDRMTAPK